MKKICSLVKATMTSDMSLFKINRKSYSKRKNTLLIFIVSFFFMIMMGVFLYRLIRNLF